MARKPRSTPPNRPSDSEMDILNILQLLGRRSAQSRYAVCVAGLVLMAAATFATFVFYQDTGRTTERALILLSIAVAETGVLPPRPASSFRRSGPGPLPPGGLTPEMLSAIAPKGVSGTAKPATSVKADVTAH